MIGPIYDLFVLFLVVVFPFWDRHESNRLRSAPTPENRIRSYCITIAWLWGATALLFARAPLGRLLRPPAVPWLGSLATGAARWPLVVGLLIGIVAPELIGLTNPAFRANQLVQLRSIDFFLPRSPRERLWFAAVAISAGICEEVIFRGFLIQYFAAQPWGLGAAGAIVASAVVFGIDHGYQGWNGMVATAVLGLGFTLVFVASQTIWVPMLFHALIDLRILLVLRSGDLDPAPSQ